MPFQINWETRPNTFGVDDRVAVLGNAENRLEVWPALGFNAYRWHAAGLDLLFRSPQIFSENRPMRSGFPILFPFPNRIRDGKFSWPISPPPAEDHLRVQDSAGKNVPRARCQSAEQESKEYRLPIGDPANTNAIHGFVANRPWRVIDSGATAGSAWITGEFHGSIDAPETCSLWPSDYRLRLTYRLVDRVLRVEADADNPGSDPLPFGLGYHPYFALAPFGGSQAALTVAAGKLWELVDNLPTGKILDVDEARDLRHGQSVAALQLDDVMTDLFTFAYDPQEQLGLVAVLQHPSHERMLSVWTSEDFRELVLFTPPHREAICMEPYTCTTDAINLVARGINGGLRTLQPGERWQGVVEMHLAQP